MELTNNKLPVLLLVAISFTVYGFSLHHEFIPYLDDSAYVLGNYAIRGFTAENLRSAFTRYFVGNYAPVHIVSYMLDYTIWGMNPMGYILTNIVAHTLNGVLLYFLVLRCGLEKWVSCCAALLFLLHPVQVESVVWISERKTVLAMFFFLASFHSYLSWQSKKTPSDRVVQYVLSLVFFVLAILSKSVAVILPVALILHDVGHLDKKSGRPCFRDKIPYILIALAGAVLAYRSQSSEMGGGRVEFHGGSLLATFMTMLPVLLKYLANLFVPVNLGIDYPVSIRHSVDAEVVFAGIVFIALILLGIFLYRRLRPLFSWYALFFLGLLPVSQIIPITTFINDRYLYFPLLGGAPFFCGVIAQVVNQRPDWRNRSVIGGVAVLLCLAMLTIRREAVWQNSVTVWNDVVRMVPDNRLAWQILLDEYTRRNDIDGALTASKGLLSCNPDDLVALNVAGQISTRKGDLAAGRSYLEHAAVLFPDNLEILFLIAENYFLAADSEKSADVLRQILQRDPSSERAKQELQKIGKPVITGTR